jgi:DNA (cytosine-5)-methyltransferase 1
VEIDCYARRVLEKHWPKVHRWDDVRSWPTPAAERVDVICGGFPCQDISYAGKGAGLHGARSGLWSEFARIVREMEPAIAIMENVSALLTRGLDQVLGTLASIGFDAEWACIPASFFALPHNRDRLFIVAYSRRFRWKTFANIGECSREGVWTAARFRGQGASVREFDGVHGKRIRILPPPGIRRMDDGLSANVDRLRGLGNAVAPTVAKWIGERVALALNDRHHTQSP